MELHWKKDVISFWWFTSPQQIEGKKLVVQGSKEASYRPLVRSTKTSGNYCIIWCSKQRHLWRRKVPSKTIGSFGMELHECLKPPRVQKQSSNLASACFLAACYVRSTVWKGPRWGSRSDSVTKWQLHSTVKGSKSYALSLRLHKSRPSYKQQGRPTGWWPARHFFFFPLDMSQDWCTTWSALYTYSIARLIIPGLVFLEESRISDDHIVSTDFHASALFQRE